MFPRKIKDNNRHLKNYTLYTPSPFINVVKMSGIHLQTTLKGGGGLEMKLFVYFSNEDMLLD